MCMLWCKSFWFYSRQFRPMYKWLSGNQTHDPRVAIWAEGTLVTFIHSDKDVYSNTRFTPLERTVASITKVAFQQVYSGYSSPGGPVFNSNQPKWNTPETADQGSELNSYGQRPSRTRVQQPCLMHSKVVCVIFFDGKIFSLTYVDKYT